MQFQRFIYPTIILLLGLFASVSANADLDADLDADILQLQQRWAEVNYQLEGKTRISAFEALAGAAENVTKQYPDAAAAWIWSGIIKSTYAGAKGGLGALEIAKQARADLEKALEVDAEALQGSAYTSLGTLYFSVPGWPVGFGNDEKAEELLQHALQVNPDGIDGNYFYGDFLSRQKRYAEARTYLLKAQAASPRPNRQVADAGRQKEITLALMEVDKHL
ncbi:MAG: tetratricopeptide repeat protein [Xanthomonadales bacterium]|nr:tetratricopeptide repeat protein [Xanthomonadales bacterium]